MNVVLDETEELDLKRHSRKALGELGKWLRSFRLPLSTALPILLVLQDESFFGATTLHCSCVLMGEEAEAGKRQPKMTEDDVWNAKNEQHVANHVQCRLVALAYAA